MMKLTAIDSPIQNLPISWIEAKQLLTTHEAILKKMRDAHRSLRNEHLSTLASTTSLKINKAENHSYMADNLVFKRFEYHIHSGPIRNSGRLASSVHAYRIHHSSSRPQESSSMANNYITLRHRILSPITQSPPLRPSESNTVCPIPTGFCNPLDCRLVRSHRHLGRDLHSASRCPRAPHQVATTTPKDRNTHHSSNTFS